MYLYISTYVLGSFMIMKKIYEYSESITNYLFNHKLISLPIEKKEKIEEFVLSSTHGILSSVVSALSITRPLFPFYIETEKNNEMHYLGSSLSFWYFVFDLYKCICNKKYLFIIHHVCAILLLGMSIYSYTLKENTGYYVMHLLFLLESNTFLLNIGFLLKEYKFHYTITCGCWIVHLFFFVLFRLIMVPKILFIYFYYTPWTKLHLIILPNFFFILSGSVYWSYRQWMGIQKYLKENCVI